jgi:GT2 family glycosyltransferase
LIPLQQLDAVPNAEPGTWLSRGVDPQFFVPCPLRAGWFRIRFKMVHEGRARVEIRADTGNGFSAAECIERINFTGSVERDFFVNVPEPVHGFRFDPLDMEGTFRLDMLEIQPVSRVGLFGRAVAGVLRQARSKGGTITAIRHGLALALRGGRREIKRELLRQIRGPSPLAPPTQDADRAYEMWTRRRELRDADRSCLRAQAAAMTASPLISILMPVLDYSEVWLRGAVESVLYQVYANWELCIATDESNASTVGSLLTEYSRRDHRVKLQVLHGSSGQAAALNSALTLASGEYVALFAPNDGLAEQALFRVAQALAEDPATDWVYSDEDRIAPDGRYVSPFFKPDWSPEYLLSLPYTGNLSVYRKSLVRELGGFREQFDPAADYDLALRMATRSPKVRHIADVLYHARDQGPRLACGESRCRAVADYLQATGRTGWVEADLDWPVHRVRFSLIGPPKVSIIIPTAYRRGTFHGETATYLARCLSSVCEKSRYRNYEILVLDNGEPPPGVLGDLARWGVVRSAYAEPFNWAAAMNQGAAQAHGEHLLFLDDDTEVIAPDWLERLVEHSQQPEIGVVGSRLHFPDGRLQHTGIAILDGLPAHPFYGLPATHPGYFFSNVVPRNYAAVTGACLMTRAEVFRTVGGFTETFAFYFNDVDYCFKVRSSGRRVVCTPYARLIHYETATKSEVVTTERSLFADRWLGARGLDPFYNPNLSTRFPDFRLEVE